MWMNYLVRPWFLFDESCVISGCNPYALNFYSVSCVSYFFLLFNSLGCVLWVYNPLSYELRRVAIELFIHLLYFLHCMVLSLVYVHILGRTLSVSSQELRKYQQFWP